MRELLRRMLSRPIIAIELLVGSLFINILALGSSLYVMQVLNRYVSQGVDATLITLTTGVLMAIALEFAFRQARASLARGVSVGPDEKTAVNGFVTLTRAKVAAIDQIPPETRKEMVSGTAAIETAYNANNITTILDVPFSLVFVFVLYVLQPIIAYIVLGFIIAVFLVGLLGGLAMQAQTAEMQEASGMGSALLGTVTREGDTVRSFNAGDMLRGSWTDHIYGLQKLRRDINARQGMVQTITQSSTGLLSVAVISVGATLVVIGEMDVGAMIAANILSARALQPISKLSQLGAAFAKARQSIEMFAKLSQVPLEPDSGSALRTYSGAVEFRDAAFAFQGANAPMFESLSLKMEPGSVLVVTGSNGTGKTTIGRLMMGLLEPIRGQILVDGLDLKQVAPEWWRRQVIYLPQEPALLNATIEQNLRVNNPEIDGTALNAIVDACGLRKFLDESPQGFETPVMDNGWRLSEGIRRRIALARGLTTNGQLAIIDEPTESLDADGCAAVHQILGALVKQGKTIIIMSHDPNVVNGPHTVLDLNEKPVPTAAEVNPAAAQVAVPPAAAAPAVENDADPADDQKVTELAQAKKKSVAATASGESSSANDQTDEVVPETATEAVGVNGALSGFAIDADAQVKK
ncbi:MAG: ATP-binding cassette domain-containing protein [Rhodospirillaceae bacterium]|nr:ATP-binding cassette domain-containing protein [Rhodospirillaceae bacterium]